MGYIRLKPLPSVDDVLKDYPLSAQASQRILEDREEIKRILDGRDHRLLIIVGPCSAWPKAAVLQYAERLMEVERALRSSLKLVMRTYIQKPRTIKGWTGPINQPDPFSPPDIEAGMHYVCDMMVKIIEMGLPIADECLFTHNTRGFSDLVSWFAIGARSSEDHEHRIVASAADCPVGMKNPTHGSIEVGVNSVVAAQHPHVALMDGYAVQTTGNPYAHLVLRGSNKAPNYFLDNLEEVAGYMTQHQITYPAVLVDASHDNSLKNGHKNHRLQPEVVFDVMSTLRKRPHLKQLVKGFMIESYLKSGNQSLEKCHANTIDLNGLSITDPCLDFPETEALLCQLARELER